MFNKVIFALRAIEYSATMSRKRGDSGDALRHTKKLFYGKKNESESDISSEDDDVDDPTFVIPQGDITGIAPLISDDDNASDDGGNDKITQDDNDGDNASAGDDGGDGVVVVMVVMLVVMVVM